MSYRHVSLTCECGEVPERILEIGLTDDHELVVHFWCSECHRAVHMSKPLTDCWRECPEPDAVPQFQAAHGPETTAADEKFLKSLGISS